MPDDKNTIGIEGAMMLNPSLRQPLGPLGEALQGRLEERMREYTAAAKAELRSRIACDILGPLRDVPPSIWALVVLAERVAQPLHPIDTYKAVEAFSEHVSQLLSTDEGKAELVAALVALGKLQRVPR